MGFNTPNTDDKPSKEKKLKKENTSKSIFIPFDEIHDSKHQSKIAHKSISPKYDIEGKLIGYNVGGWSQSYIKNQAEEKRKKLKSIQ